MTGGEKKAFEKFFLEEFGEGWGPADAALKEIVERAFLEGYRAGFQAQHFDTDQLTPPAS